MPVRERRLQASRWVPHALGAVGEILVPDGFVPGKTYPTSANMGFAANGVTEAQLTHYTGDIDLASLTKSLTRTFVHGRIYGRPTNPAYIVDECWVDGGNSPVAGGLIDCTRAGTTPVTVKRTKVRPQIPMQQANGFQGHDYVCERVDISGVVDAWRVHNTSAQGQPSGVKIWSSYGHHLAYFTPDTQSDNQTHNDVIQLEGGTGLDVWGTRLSSFGDPVLGNIKDRLDQVRGTKLETLSCLIITPSAAGGGSVNGWRLRNSWLEGAMVKLNVAEKALGTQIGIDLTGNRFGTVAGRDGGYSNPTLIDSATLAANRGNWTDNLWANDLTPITLNGR